MRSLISYYIALGVGLLLFTNTLSARIPIAVVDTGIRKTHIIKPYLCDQEIDLTGHGIYDAHGHGTNIAHILASHIDKRRYCLFIIKWYHNEQVEDTIKGIEYAFKVGNIAVSIMSAIKKSQARYVNMSLSGTISYWKELQMIRELLQDGVVFAVAAGNDGKDLSKSCNVYPACYDINHGNFYVIGGSKNGIISHSFNHGGPVDSYEEAYDISAGGFKFSGTSQATPIFLGKLIKRLKYKTPGVIIRRGV